MRKIFILCSLLPLISCSPNRLDQVDFLVGTWMVEGKNQYEAWTMNNRNELMGYSYEIHNDQKTILETLVIRMMDDQIVYEATVPDQNEGLSIRFTLNPASGSFYSFENFNHDFPKQIQYHPLSDDEIMIRVLGDGGEGFSYRLIRQENE